MEDHAQLTAQQKIVGSYNQLLVNLLGDKGDEWLKALNRFLRKENPWGHTFVFQEWRKISRGLYVNASEYRTVLRAARRPQTQDAARVMPHVPYPQAEDVVELVLASPADFGFGWPYPRYKDFIEAAQSAGLVLCPPDVGPALRLEYSDQVPGESIFVAMEPLSDPKDGKSVIFVLTKDNDGPQLDLVHMKQKTFLRLDSVFVFLKKIPESQEGFPGLDSAGVKGAAEIGRRELRG